MHSARLRLNEARDNIWPRPHACRATNLNYDNHCQFRLLAQSGPQWVRYNAEARCETKSFQNFFNLPGRPSKIILFQSVETCMKLFQNYSRGLLQLMNIFQHVQRHWNNFRTLSAAEIIFRVLVYIIILFVVSRSIKYALCVEYLARCLCYWRWKNSDDLEIRVPDGSRSILVLAQFWGNWCRLRHSIVSGLQKYCNSLYELI